MKLFSTCSLALLAALLLTFAAPATADLVLTEVNHTDAYQAMGQAMPAATDTVLIWFGGQKARMDTGNQSTVILLADKKLIYVINHEQKTYSPIALSAGLAGVMPKNMSAQDSMAMQQMMAGMAGSIKITVTPTDETKKIRDWNATKYLVDMTLPMGTMHSETWASEDIKIDTQLFHEMNVAALAWMPGMTESLKEMEKIKGCPVLTTSTADMMGTQIRQTEELIGYGERPAPSGLYELPAGYREKALME